MYEFYSRVLRHLTEDLPGEHPPPKTEEKEHMSQTPLIQRGHT